MLHVHVYRSSTSLQVHHVCYRPYNTAGRLWSDASIYTPEVCVYMYMCESSEVEYIVFMNVYLIVCTGLCNNSFGNSADRQLVIQPCWSARA